MRDNGLKALSMLGPTDPPKLPEAVALAVAEAAGVPQEHHEFFSDCLRGVIRCVWEQQPGPKYKPGRALEEAANATRRLREASHNFSRDDLDRIERILKSEPANLKTEFDELRRTVWKLDFIFSTAIRRPMTADKSIGELGKRGAKRKSGDIGDQTFRYLVEGILLSAKCARGDLTLDKNLGQGSLVDALNILRPHVPAGTIDASLSFSTIQRIKTRFSKRSH